MDRAAEAVRIIECPRDAWQGLPGIIPTEAKVAYLRKLIEAGFRHLDAVSFVSPGHVPQMADSEAVVRQLLGPGVPKNDTRNSDLETRDASRQPPAEDLNLEFQPSSMAPEIIGIVVNEQGLDRALATTGVSTVGYPYSISANFRRQNANMSLSQSRALVRKLYSATKASGRNLVVYVSMAFGNPFDEPWGAEIVEEAIRWLKEVGIRTISLADTVGTASPEQVGELFGAMKDAASGIEVGVHLHSRPEGVAEKVVAAYEAGCRRFDSALTGLGGCPFAGDELVGNISTEVVISTLHAKGAQTGIEPWALLRAVEATKELRNRYAQ